MKEAKSSKWMYLRSIADIRKLSEITDGIGKVVL